jgi:hypothetical protein
VNKSKKKASGINLTEVDKERVRLQHMSSPHLSLPQKAVDETV